MNVVKKKHQQLYDILLHALSIGIYPDGAKLPKMTELAEKYSVSVNIVTKAIAMLKEKNLVTIKAGDGIFSNAGNLKKEKQPQRFSGEKIFSAYEKSKKISVLVEDSAPWQLEFWNAYFEKFTQQNPDIEIKATFGYASLPCCKRHDLVIGGNHFINRSGYTINDFLETEELESFRKGLYNETSITPDDLTWNGKRFIYPISFQLPLLLHKGINCNTDKRGTVLDFIEAQKKYSRQKQVRYMVWSLQQLMVNAGCHCIDPSKGEFEFDDRSKWEKNIERIKQIYSSGDMVFIHGKPLDYNSIVKKELGQGIYYTEFPYNNLNSTDIRNVDISPYPIGDTFPLIHIGACISQDTPFPEEALRIISGLLEPQTQQDCLERKIGFPILSKTLETSSFAYLAGQIRERKKLLVTPCVRVLDDAIETVLTWELYYYFTGKITGDVLSRIEKKVGFFIKNYNFQYQEISDEKD